MRKIERQMVAAIKAMKNFHSGNTAVVIETTQHEKRALVALHGNRIAEVYVDGTVKVTLAGWPTATTRSRVNAILREFVAEGANVFQAKGNQFIFAHFRHAPTPDVGYLDAAAWLTFDADGYRVA